MMWCPRSIYSLRRLSIHQSKRARYSSSVKSTDDKVAPRVLISGHSIAGLCAALALQRHHPGKVALQLVPSDVTPSVHESTILYPNALGHLRDLGVLDAILAKGCVLSSSSICSGSKGRKISTLNYSGISKKYGDLPVVAIQVSALQKILESELASTKLRLREKDGLTSFKNVGEKGKETVSCSLKKLTNLTYDALILTDQSKLATKSFPPPKPDVSRMAKLETWHGIVPMSLMAQEGQQVRLKGNTVTLEWFPVGGNLQYFGAASFSRFSNFYGAAEKTGQEFIERFSKFLNGDEAELLKETLSQHKKEKVATTNYLSEFVQHSWKEGRVVLMGGAAYCILPALHQQVAMEVEDGVVMATMLAQSSANDVEDSLERFAEQRKKRVEEVATIASGKCRADTADYKFPGLRHLRNVLVSETSPVRSHTLKKIIKNTPPFKTNV